MTDLAMLHVYIGCMMALAAPAFVAVLVLLVDGIWPGLFSYAQGVSSESGFAVHGVLCVVARPAGYEITFLSLAAVVHVLSAALVGIHRLSSWRIHIWIVSR